MKNLKKNRFGLVIVLTLLFVVSLSVYKLYFSKQKYVYVKIKVGQGYWWASTQKPSLWFIEAMKKNREEKGLFGEPSAKLLQVIYYPWFSSGQYDVYLTARLKVSKTPSTNSYSFKRSTIGVGSPIDLEFSSVQLSGTIIDISEKPFHDTYVEKTIYLTKKYAFPWEYDAVQVGDGYFNGVENVFTVLDKTAVKNNTIDMEDSAKGDTPSVITEPRLYVTVRAKIKVRVIDGKLMFAEEQLVIPGKTLGITTSHFLFNDFAVARIE